MQEDLDSEAYRWGIEVTGWLATAARTASCHTAPVVGLYEPGTPATFTTYSEAETTRRAKGEQEGGRASSDRVPSLMNERRTDQWIRRARRAAAFDEACWRADSVKSP